MDRAGLGLEHAVRHRQGRATRIAPHVREVLFTDLVSSRGEVFMRARLAIVAVLVVACSSKEATPANKGSSASGSAAPTPAPSPTPGPAVAKRGPSGQAPAWVPLYPGATPPAGFMKAGNGWAFNQETTDAPDAIFAFYEKALTDAGLTVKVIRTPATPKVPGVVQATSTEPPRTLSLTVSQTGDKGAGGVNQLLFMTEGE